MIFGKKVTKKGYFWFLVGNDNSFLIGGINFYEAKSVMSHISYTGIFKYGIPLTFDPYYGMVSGW